jgi:hypothetical protein
MMGTSSKHFSFDRIVRETHFKKGLSTSMLSMKFIKRIVKRHINYKMERSFPERLCLAEKLDFLGLIYILDMVLPHPLVIPVLPA